MMNSGIIDRTIDQLCDRAFECSCGKTHRVQIRKILLKAGALEEVHHIIRELGLCGTGLIIADGHTWQAAGKRVKENLSAQGLLAEECIFHEEELHADEKAVGKVIIQADQGIQFLMAVGSGTINDITRFAAHRLGVPYICIATAPSMDGYASTVSPLLVNGFKKTYSAVYPTAIIGDLEVLKKAPQEMIAAGFGDILGKVTALADWTLGRAVNREYHCPVIASLVQTAVKQCVGSVEGLVTRQDEAILGLMEALILSGMAIQMVGNSRPASGAEHHLSHFWEMQDLWSGCKIRLHGINVGVAMPLIMAMYEKVLKWDSDEIQAREKSHEQKECWKREIQRCFGMLAEEAISEGTVNQLPQLLDERMKRLSEQWDSLKAELSDILAMVSDIKALLKKAGGFSGTKELGKNRQQVLDALCFGKEVRSRYTILQLADQLGVLHQYAEEIVDEEYGR